MNNNPFNLPEEDIVTQPRIHESAPILINTHTFRKTNIWKDSHVFVLVTFLAFIFIGIVLLSLPIANNCHLDQTQCTNNNYTPLRISILTATSAATVTGHIVVDTSTYWSTFGQVIIFTMMLIGGLGFMTAATFILVLIGQRSTLPQRILMKDMGFDKIEGLKKLSFNIILVVAILYLVGFLSIWVLSTGLFEASSGVRIWNSIFLSVSAFNNAGFTINSGGTSILNNNYPLISVFVLLIILGGIGWATLVDVFRHRIFNRLTLTSKLIITANIILWIIGFITFMGLEFANDTTIGQLGFVDQIASSIFHSVSGRTAGFTIVEMSNTRDFTKLIYSILMFIGGSPGSVAGGIKTTVIAIIGVAVISSLRGRSQPEIFGREIAHFQVMKALAVTGISIVIVLLVTPTITLLHPELPFIDVLFDVFSAYGTTGSSTGIISSLGLPSSVLLSVTMLLGRLIPLYLAFSLIIENNSYRFMQEQVTLG